MHCWMVEQTKTWCIVLLLLHIFPKLCQCPLLLLLLFVTIELAKDEHIHTLEFQRTHTLCALSMYVSSDYTARAADSQTSCWRSALHVPIVYIEAVVAQELKHHTLWAASLVQRMWCAVKVEKKIWRTSTCYLERHKLFCPYSSLDVANHTGGI